MINAIINVTGNEMIEYKNEFLNPITNGRLVNNSSKFLIPNVAEFRLKISARGVNAFSITIKNGKIVNKKIAIKLGNSKANGTQILTFLSKIPNSVSFFCCLFFNNQLKNIIRSY